MRDLPRAETIQSTSRRADGPHGTASDLAVVTSSA
jgi:hypothetical protein